MNLYIAKLDTLRFYAVAMVIIAHALEIWKWNLNTVFALPFGNSGVLIFFVLSGFLITSILITNNEQSNSKIIQNFYMRRLLRIFPIYYLYLTVMYSFNIDDIQTAGVMPWLYLTNIYMFANDSWLNSHSHLWTLAIEEQFYLVWPFLIVLFAKNRVVIKKILIGLVLFSILMRLTLSLYQIDYWPRIETFTLTNLDALAIGALLAMYYQSSNTQLKQYQYVLIIGGLVSYYLLYCLKIYLNLEATFLALSKVAVNCLAAGIIIYCLFSTQKYGIFHNAVTVYLGKISYGIYLYHNVLLTFHLQILSFFGLELAASLATKVFIAVPMTLLLAMISFHIVEKPLLNLKHKFK